MENSDLSNRLAFLKAAEGLKKTLRSAHLSDGTTESTAEHTWRLCLWVLTLADQYPALDIEKLLKICILHDLGEAISGDIPAPLQTDSSDKQAQERADWQTLTAPLPDHLRTEFLNLWEEYETAASPEARIAKGLDKLETILQHNQGQNPHDFDYAFNLEYGAKHTGTDALLIQIRTILDAETTAKI